MKRNNKVIANIFRLPKSRGTGPDDISGVLRVVAAPADTQVFRYCSSLQQYSTVPVLETIINTLL